MSQNNEKIEETIRISEELIQQLERYRDQGRAYGEAADNLQKLSRRLEELESQFERLTPETLEKRLSTIETSVASRTLVLILLSSAILTASVLALVFN